ncbi:F0F1 ATP synthase subunit delta [Aestuariirhabdus litorea]|uniref:ATP synthase subunit delta n=1 Tax=Aestuariirhabdus litorea TaxID=2528527 RepID=A0A3P3VP82_9GAMM|nr:F0F1 ATP synthase subunit delta [Aestuariirhabdus litorea]RRJ82623.1 F0F1 ATP synthase subunit delta [Aestuariirhabdus litorea]RWW92783.1 F0F1 ATP synthase subunit delta [Endozoicomonadaceae bacterium GTF-13]
MAELTTVARPYAKAAFEAAQDSGDLDLWAGMLQLGAAVAKDDSMKLFLDYPALSREQKAAAFVDVCEGKLNEEAKNLFTVMAENNRLGLLPEVSALFENFKAQQEKQIDVKVETAFDMSDKQQSALAQALSKKLDRKVNLSSETHAELIGGVVIRAADLVIDASVRSKISKLAEAINS